MLTKFYAPRAIAHPAACDATKRKANRAAIQARHRAKNKLLIEARAMCIIVAPPIRKPRYTGRA
jgi:hypothetical protein